MSKNEQFIKEFEKHIICVDYDTQDTGYVTITFEFRCVYRVTILNKEGENKWFVEISMSNHDKQNVPVYNVLQQETVRDVKNVIKILRNVKKASKAPNVLVYDFT